MVKPMMPGADEAERVAPAVREREPALPVDVTPEVGLRLERRALRARRQLEVVLLPQPLRLAHESEILRVDEAVEEVDEQVHRDHDDGDQQRRVLDQRVVARADRLQQDVADAGEAVDRLDDRAAGDQRADLEADDRDDRDEGVTERVPVDHAPRRQALRLRGPDVVAPRAPRASSRGSSASAARA